MSDTDANRRHAEKMRTYKAAKERSLAAKSDSKGLLMVHTGAGKGKTSPRSAWSSATSPTTGRSRWCSSSRRRTG